MFSVVFDIAQDSATSDHISWQLLQADLKGQMFQIFVAHFKEKHRCLFFLNREALCTQTYAPASHIRHNAIILVGGMTQ